MKNFSFALVFLASFAFAQEEISVENDSVYVPKFDLKLNQDFEKFDLGLRIKSWDDETWEEKQKKRRRYEHLNFPGSIVRQTLDGIFEGILNNLISKK